MKSTLLAFFCLAISSQIFGQSGKFTVGMEYSPNYTNNTNPGRSFENGTGSRLAHNVFVKGGYRVVKDLYATASVGYLNTSEFITLHLINGSDITRIESDRTHSYVIAPFGFTYNFVPFFVSPEIGIGWNTGNRSHDIFYYEDGSQLESETQDIHNFYGVHKNTYPLFLSFGSEVKVGSFAVLLGMKGYYSLNEIGDRYSNAGHYYGFGVLAGVKF